MADVNKSDNMNQGLPDKTGLDDDTRASIQRSLDAGNDGIAVGSIADLQRGTVDSPLKGPFNPTQPTENLVSPGESDAQAGIASLEAERESKGSSKSAKKSADS